MKFYTQQVLCRKNAGSLYLRKYSLDNETLLLFFLKVFQALFGSQKAANVLYVIFKITLVGENHFDIQP